MLCVLLLYNYSLRVLLTCAVAPASLPLFAIENN